MSDSKRFFHPETIRRITRLELRARHIVEGFLSGARRSPYSGQSIEFRQRREYVRGDDPRYIDWKVWAKQDRLYIKQFESETNLRCALLCDVSESMRYGRGPLTKYEYACTVAASLAYMLQRNRDAVGSLTFDEGPRETLPIRSSRNHLDSIVRSLDVSTPERKTDMERSLRHAAETYPRRGMVVVISDFFVPREGLFQGLRYLKSRDHDVLVFQILDDDELDFPFDGPTRFEGMESQDVLRCNPRALREDYLRELHSFLDELRHGCSRMEIDYALFRTSQPLDAALTAFLTRRQELLRR